MKPINILCSQTIPHDKLKKSLPRGISLVFVVCLLSALNWTLPYLCSLVLKPIFILIPLMSDSGSVPLLANITAQILTISGLTFAGLKISGLKWNDIYFPPRLNTLKCILGGIAAGVVYGILIKFSDYHPAVWLKGIPGIITAARIVIISPFLEELFCRGLIFRLLQEEVPPRVNIFINSLIYALTHYHFVDFLGLIGIAGPIANPTSGRAILVFFVLGTICAFIRHRSRSIWPAISVHVTYNLTLFLL